MKRNLETDFGTKAMRLRDEVSEIITYTYRNQKNIADVMTSSDKNIQTINKQMDSLDLLRMGGMLE